jgi:hypothetical protein
MLGGGGSWGAVGDGNRGGRIPVAAIRLSKAVGAVRGIAVTVSVG